MRPTIKKTTNLPIKGASSTTTQQQHSTQQTRPQTRLIKTRLTRPGQAYNAAILIFLKSYSTEESLDKTACEEPTPEPIVRMTTTRRQGLVELFHSVDANHDGSISRMELVRALSLDGNLKAMLSSIPGLGNEMTTARLRKCLKEMDGDKNESIDQFVFIDYIEDIADTAMLVTAFDAVELDAETDMAPIDDVIKEFDRHQHLGVSTIHLLHTIKEEVESARELGMISKDDWMDVAFQHLNDLTDDEKVLTSQPHDGKVLMSQSQAVRPTIHCTMMHEAKYEQVIDATEWYCDECAEMLGDDDSLNYVCRPCDWSICSTCVAIKYPQQSMTKEDKINADVEEKKKEQEQEQEKTNEKNTKTKEHNEEEEKVEVKGKVEVKEKVEAEENAEVKEKPEVKEKAEIKERLEVKVQPKVEDILEVDKQVDKQVLGSEGKAGQAGTAGLQEEVEVKQADKQVEIMNSNNQDDDTKSNHLSTTIKGGSRVMATSTEPTITNNTKDLGTNLPAALKRAAQNKKLSLMALHAVVKNQDAITVLETILNEAGSTTEREIVLDGIVRRVPTHTLVKHAREAAQMRIMVDLAIQQSSSKSASASIDITSMNVVEAITQKLNFRATAVPTTPPRTIDTDTQQLRSSPVSSAKRRGLQLVFLMAEPMSKDDACKFGIGRPTNHRLAQHLTATLHWHHVNGLNVLQQYVLKKMSPQAFLDNVLSLNDTQKLPSSSSSESIYCATSSVVHHISSVVSEVERGLRPSPKKKSRMGHRQGFHNHNFLVTSFPHNSLNSVQELVSRLSSLFSNIVWRIVYLRAPNPNGATAKALQHRKGWSVTKAQLMKVEKNIRTEQEQFRARVAALCHYAENQPPRLQTNRNLSDLQINSTITERVKNKRKSTARIKYPWITKFNLQDETTYVDVHTLATRVYAFIQGICVPEPLHVPISATWVVNANGNISEASQSHPQQTMPPSLDVSNIKKKNWKNKHQIIKQNSTGIKILKRGQWKLCEKNRGGSELLRKRLELQLSQARNISRVKRPLQPFPLPLSPFATRSCESKPSPLTRRIRSKPPPPPLTLEMELWSWLKRLGLQVWPRISEPTKWRRNLQNGYVVAEILERYYRPVGVRNGRHRATDPKKHYNLPLHALDPCATHERKKRDNWRIVEQFLKRKSIDVSYVENNVTKGRIVRKRRETPLPKKTHGIHDYKSFNKQQNSQQQQLLDSRTRNKNKLLQHEDIIDGTMHGAPGHGLSMLESIYFWLNQHENKVPTLSNLCWQTSDVVEEVSKDDEEFDDWNYDCFEFIRKNLASGLHRLVGMIKRSTHGNNRLDLRGFQDGGVMDAKELNHVMKSQFNISFDAKRGWSNDAQGSSINMPKVDNGSGAQFGSELDIIIYFFDHDNDGKLNFDEIYQKLVRWEERIEQLNYNDHKAIVEEYMLNNEQWWERNVQLIAANDVKGETSTCTSDIDASSRSSCSSSMHEDGFQRRLQNSVQSYQDPVHSYQDPDLVHQSQSRQYEYSKQQQHCEDDEQQQNCEYNEHHEQQIDHSSSSATDYVVPAPPLEKDEFSLLSQEYVPAWYDGDDRDDDEGEPAWVTRERNAAQLEGPDGDAFLQTAAINSSMHKYEQWPSY